MKLIRHNNECKSGSEGGTPAQSSSSNASGKASHLARCVVRASNLWRLTVAFTVYIEKSLSLHLYFSKEVTSFASETSVSSSHTIALHTHTSIVVDSVLRAVASITIKAHHQTVPPH